MKYILLLLVILIVGTTVYTFFSPITEPAAFTMALQHQANPFTAPKDSSEIIWARAKKFLGDRERVLSGGDLQVTDTSYYIPYYNDHKKGNSISIVRKPVGDSVVFYVQYWYSQNPSEKGAKEIALFMRQHRSRYDNW